jgi:uncharacterized membrane protein
MLCFDSEEGRMDSDQAVLAYVAVAVVIVFLLAKFGKRFGIRTMAEERAEQTSRSEEYARRARVELANSSITPSE